MIKTELIAPNILKIIAPELLRSEDFLELVPKFEHIVEQHDKIRLLIDASRLNGWENVAALEKHAVFVKDRQHKVDRIAIIVQHEWQHWLVGAVGVFLHPEVRAFDKTQRDGALQWIAN